MTAFNARLGTTLNEIFDRLLGSEEIAPGAAFAVVHEGVVVHLLGRGESELGSGRVPTADTGFRVASLTKSFTAAAIRALAERGLVDVRDPISRYIPQLVSPTAAELTIEHCLTMVPGLPTDDPWADRQESLSDEAFDRLCAAGLGFVRAPGESFEYSNLGFALLGRVIQRVTGRDVPDAVRELILEPLRLENTDYDVSRVSRLATGYRRAGSEWEPQRPTGPGAFSAIGGISSTIADLARWADWMSDAFRAEPRLDIGPISAQGRRDMQRVHRAIVAPPETALGAVPTKRATTGYGWGFFIDEDPERGRIVHHSGGYPGFGTHMRWHANSGWGIIAWANGTYASASAAAAELCDALLDGLGIGVSAADAWPETRRAQDAVTRWLCGEEADYADLPLSENLFQDRPWAERVEDRLAILDEVGMQVSSVAVRSWSGTPAHRMWWLRTEHGWIRAEVKLGPMRPVLLQSVSVTAVAADAGPEPHIMTPNE